MRYVNLPSEIVSVTAGSLTTALGLCCRISWPTSARNRLHAISRILFMVYYLLF